MSVKDDAKQMQAIFKGKVQGVGFRETCRRYALHLGILGTVRNLQDESVEVIAEADQDTLEAYIEALRTKPRGAKIKSVDTEFKPSTHAFEDFRVLHG